MKDILQEKFQVVPPRAHTDGSESWVTFESARRPRPQKSLVLPSENINEPTMTNMPLSMAGETDVTNAVNLENVRKGWNQHKMISTDDQYTSEHVDLFYGEAKGSDDGGDKVTGFVERNNYLDRI